jgi:hypothetical protein
MLSTRLHIWRRLAAPAASLLTAAGLLPLPDGFDRRAVAATFSILCNFVFFWLLFRHEVQPGDAQLLASDSLPVLIAAPSAQTPTASAASTPPSPSAPAPPEVAEPDVELPAAPQVATLEPEAQSEIEPQIVAAAPPSPIPPDDIGTEPPPPPRTVSISPAQQAMLTQKLETAAQALLNAQQSTVSWSENGQLYNATLAREPSEDSMALEQVVARVTTTSADGTQLQTQLKVQRLAFSQFTQVVDYWDARVQLHDDEIVGRFHSNSPFAIAADGDAAPKFLGKVTTAARGLTFTSGAGRRDKMFEGGLQMRAGRIELPDRARPFAIAPERDAYVHNFTEDAHLAFAADGSYTVRARRADAPEQRQYPQDRPSYFIAPKGVTLFVRGTVHGKVLVYSAERIVIEGNLIYATNPRTTPDVDDYLGLVSDRNVEVAPPYVTGRGDLNIHAAVFARSRFVVTNIDYPRDYARTATARTATLFLYGSLTVGSISATEPRYATKLEFDPRFDRVRPPGFPNTNRYEIASWQAAWGELNP